MHDQASPRLDNDIFETAFQLAVRRLGTEATAEQIVATMLADPSVVAHVLRVASQANVKEWR